MMRSHSKTGMVEPLFDIQFKLTASYVCCVPLKYHQLLCLRPGGGVVGGCHGDDVGVCCGGVLQWLIGLLVVTVVMVDCDKSFVPITVIIADKPLVPIS